MQLKLPHHPLVLLCIGIGTGWLLSLFFTSHNLHQSTPGRTTSSFLVDPSLFIPPPSRPPPPANLPLPVSAKEEGMLVPDAVHYVYGLKPVPAGEKGEELPYYAYLAMRSAMINLRPSVIYFHYQHLPYGPWWDLLEPELTLIKTEPPTHIFGNPIHQFAHQADVLRLLAMKHSGGIYLDIDVFVVKPFDDLLYFPTTLGMEASPDSRRTPLDPGGLCNAVIVSAPHSSFIDRWLASYESFDGNLWAVHSVVVPWEIARRYPDEIQVLSTRAFFWPMWQGEEVQYTHERDDHDFRKSGQYAYHAWESLSMEYLSKLSPWSIRDEDNSFNRLARAFVAPEDDEVYQKWIKGGTG